MVARSSVIRRSFIFVDSFIPTDLALSIIQIQLNEWMCESVGFRPFISSSFFFIWCIEQIPAMIRGVKKDLIFVSRWNLKLFVESKTKCFLLVVHKKSPSAIGPLPSNGMTHDYDDYHSLFNNNKQRVQCSLLVYIHF